MTIKEVCEQYDITPDTLRYYEKVGAIPSVSRTKGGIRDYTEEDMKWIHNAICMRNAGVPVDMLVEYVKLFLEGDETIQARYDLLVKAREEIQKQADELQNTLNLINYKVSRYKEAIKTGVLVWDADHKEMGE